MNAKPVYIGNGDSLLQTVDETLPFLERLGPMDMAAVSLARSYAAQIDLDPDLLGKLGPYLLRTLEALGGSPRARKVLERPSPASKEEKKEPEGILGQLRAVRSV